MPFSFLNPTLFAVGLASVAIPILVHILMRRRRRPVPWAAMRFLLEAYRQQRRRTRLEQLLLLAARCLLVAALATAIGRPALSAAGFLQSAGPRTLIVVIDNSLASGLEVGGATELDGLKARADAALKGLSVSRGDSVALIAAAGPAAAVVSPPSTDLAGVMDALRRLGPADSGADLVGALALVRQVAAESTGAPPTVLLLSPWRAGVADLARPLPPLDLGERVRIVASAPAELASTNITLVDASPTRSVLIAPEGGEAAVQTQVRLQLRRSGELPAVVSPVEVRAVGLSGAASPAVGAAVSWNAGQTSAAAAVNLDVPADLIRQGPAVALLARVRGDGLAADDRFVRPVLARRQVKVAIVSPRAAPNARPDQFSPAEWLSLALAPSATALDRRGSEIEVLAVDPGAAGAAGDVLAADAVFVAAPDRLDAAMIQSLRRMLDAGRLIVLMPAAAEGAAGWTDRLAAGLDLPWTFAREPRTVESASLIVPAGNDAGPLALLGPELAELIKPVRVSRLLPVQAAADRTHTLLALADGTPMVSTTVPDSTRGLVVYLASAAELSWSNLPAMPLMVPLVQEVLRQGLGESGTSGAAVAGRPAVWPKGAEQYRRVELPDVKASNPVDPAPPRIPESAGLFRTTDGASRTLGLFAVNPEPDAGRVETAPRADVERWLAPLAAPGRFAWLEGPAGGPGEAGSGTLTPVQERSTPLDVPLLGLAAGLGVLEMFLARRFSHASAAGRTPGLSASLPTGGGIVAAPHEEGAA